MQCKTVKYVLLTIVVLPAIIATAEAAQKRYEPNWQSLDSRPTPEWFLDAKFGIFIHWGIYSVPAWGPEDAYSEWYWRHAFNADGTLQDNDWGNFHRGNYGSSFAYSVFAPMFRCELFEPAEWADLFARAGAKYVVLTSKHHDGFCLWPSEEANKTWGRLWNSTEVGPRRDLLGELGAAVRRANLKMGLYYSLYEWFNPLWRMDRQRYVTEHMWPQFKDVVTNYKPALIFSDGEWDMTDKQWKSPELLAWLFNESAVRNEVVINDRWGKDIRHKHGGYYTTEYGAGLDQGTHPWEENRGIGNSFGYNRNEPLSNYKGVRELVLMLVDLVSRGGNLLLDVGPTADGRIPLIMQDRLLGIGRWLSVNGEAIYGTKAWNRNCQWSQGDVPDRSYGQHKTQYSILDLVEPSEKGRASIEVFFTSKPELIYAIVPRWPGRELILRDVDPKDNAVVTMLGLKRNLPWQRKGKDIAVDLSEISPEMLPCRDAYAFKVPIRKPVKKPKPAEQPREEEEEPEDELERAIFDALQGIFK